MKDGGHRAGRVALKNEPVRGCPDGGGVAPVADGGAAHLWAFVAEDRRQAHAVERVMCLREKGWARSMSVG